MFKDFWGGERVISIKLVPSSDLMYMKEWEFHYLRYMKA